MVIAGLVLAGIAALLHVYIFYLESIAWTSDRARATFGTTPAEAETTKSLALNQGFYNLFLAVGAALGIILFASGAEAIGLTLVFVGVGSMLAASVVLIVTSPSKASAAVKQGLVPLLAVIALLVGVLL
jgi:putative membrane protein